MGWWLLFSFICWIIWIVLVKQVYFVNAHPCYYLIGLVNDTCWEIIGLVNDTCWAYVDFIFMLHLGAGLKRINVIFVGDHTSDCDVTRSCTTIYIYILVIIYLVHLFSRIRWDYESRHDGKCLFIKWSRRYLIYYYDA